METTTTQPETHPSPQPQAEHAWLQQLVGDWQIEGEMATGPDQPSMTFTATERVRSLGGLWFLAEVEGEMPDGDAMTSVMTLGYDPRRGRYVGTFIGSMMTNLWVYDGVMDEGGRVLTLHTEGPSMTAEGKLTPYKDVIELTSADERLMRSWFVGEDGAWQQLMTWRYRRLT
jgi:hypothetical protein